LNYDWKMKETLSFNWSLNSSYSRVSSFNYLNNEGYTKDQLTFSLLNSAHIQILPDWTISFLFRSEWYDGLFVEFIPSIGTEYWLDKSHFSSLKMNLSRNYHQPNLNDLYWIPGGNPDLKPEDGFSGDLAFACNKVIGSSTLSGQIAGFTSLIDNWIEWGPALSGAYYPEASNIHKVFARGVEIQASEQILTANAIQFNLRGNYSYTATSNIDAVPSIDESRGKQLIYIPKHKANLFAEADYKSYYIKMNVPFTGKRYVTSNNVESDYEQVLNPYCLVNLSMGKKLVWKHLQADVSLNIENLTSQDYMAILWRPMPGRYYSLTMQIQFRK
jgi:outer membrane cobalamin receptor